MNSFFTNSSMFFLTVLLAMPLAGVKRKIDWDKEEVELQESEIVSLQPLFPSHQNELNAQLIEAVEKNDSELAEKLLARGASPDSIKSGWDIPLVIAGRNLNAEMVKILLQAEADPNIEIVGYPHTPLSSIVRLDAPTPAAQETKLAITRLLLENGALVNKKNFFGNTPLLSAVDSATNNDDVIKLLLSYGANVNTTKPSDSVWDQAGKTILGRLLIHFKNKGATLWTEAASTDSFSLYRLLWQYGATMLENEKGDPANYAQQLKTIYRVDDLPNVFITVLEKSFPNNPLIPAIIGNNISRVKELLEKSSEVVKDAEGVSALVYAAGQGNYEILMMLLEYPTYRRDLEGLEQALEIIGARLSGLGATSPEYQNYQNIQTVLKDMLDEMRRKQRIKELAEPASIKFSENPLLALPIEMWYHILGYLPAATLPVFSAAVSVKFKDK
jgi:ankyrin repeat protein